MSHAVTPTISAEERAKRQYAVDFARNSVRLEGIVLSPAVEAINQRYIDGEIDSATRQALSFAASESLYGNT